MDSKQETQKNAPSKEEAPDIQAENEVEEDEVPFFDLSNHYIKPDMFDGIHILDEAFEKIEGAPNFRLVNLQRMQWWRSSTKPNQGRKTKRSSGSQ